MFARRPGGIIVRGPGSPFMEGPKGDSDSEVNFIDKGGSGPLIWDSSSKAGGPLWEEALEAWCISFSFRIFLP